MIVSSFHDIVYSMFKWPEGEREVRTGKRDGIIRDRVLIDEEGTKHYFLKGELIMSFSPGGTLRVERGEAPGTSSPKRMRVLASLGTHFELQPTRLHYLAVDNSGVIITPPHQWTKEFYTTQKMVPVVPAEDWMYSGTFFRYPVEFKDGVLSVPLQDIIRKEIESAFFISFAWRNIAQYLCALKFFGNDFSEDQIRDMISSIYADLRLSGKKWMH